MSAGAHLLGESEPHAHQAQFYGQDERASVANAAQFLGEGLGQGRGALAVTTEKHREALFRHLKKRHIHPPTAIAEGRLVVLDAPTMLAQIVVDGQPEWSRFDATIGGPVRRLLASTRLNGLRAFGEMVGLLWSAGQRQAAVRLEEFWNRLLARHRFSLFCAYPIDVLSAEFREAAVEPLLSAHTHVLPASSQVHRAVDRALDESLARSGTDRRRLAAAAGGSRKGAAPSASILYIRNHMPEEAAAIFARARESLAAAVGKPARPRRVKTGDAARLLGTTTRTLLFYEEEGLVRPTRTPGGSRIYSPFDLARAEAAIRLSRLGFPLRLIKAMTAVRPTSASGREASERLVALFAEMRQDILGRLGALQAVADDLDRADHLVRQCASCPRQPNRECCPSCPCELGLADSMILHLTADPGR